MAVEIAVVCDDRLYSADLIAALAATGLTDVAYFSDPMLALDRLLQPEQIELLVSRIDFGPGKLHGVGLARMAKSRHRTAKVILLGEEEHRPYVDGTGELVLLATAPPILAEHVHELVLRRRDYMKG